MARLPRLSLGGWPHLVLQRGHNRQAVVVDDEDRAQLRTALADAAHQHGLAVHAFALQDDEFRLLATPGSDTGLSLAMQAIGRRYGAWFNRRHGRVGSLWEGRFRAAMIEPEQHLLSAMRFVEADTDGQAPWSSRPVHFGIRADTLVSHHPFFWSLGNTPFEREIAYRREFEAPRSAAEGDVMRHALQRGWPLGSADFLERLAATTDRALAPRPRGRPRTRIDVDV